MTQLVLMVAFAVAVSAADPAVPNVSFAQRPETKLVDIIYDLTADDGVKIVVAISADGGATWAVPAQLNAKIEEKESLGKR